MYKIEIDKWIKQVDIGSQVVSFDPVSGGLLHKMYKVKTDKGLYAIKALNPTIMARPNVVAHYIESEEFASICIDRGVPGIVSNKYTDGHLNKCEDQYFLVYDWSDGVSIFGDEIGIKHAKHVGQLLSKIHQVPFESKCDAKGDKAVRLPVEWSNYIKHEEAIAKVWFSKFNSYLDFIGALDQTVLQYKETMDGRVVFSHRDLDPKNILWHLDAPYVIDWESAGYVHPMEELAELIFYWATDGLDLHADKVKAILSAYEEAGCQITKHLEGALYCAFENKLMWLKYSFERSLGMIDCSQEERKLGSSEVFETLEMIYQQEKMIPKIVKLIKG